MKRILILICLIATIGISLYAKPYVPKTGDIIFHSSKSGQSTAIKIGTLSPYSHCGIIVVKDNKPYVLEAENGVELTPLKSFIERGLLGKHYRIMRLKHPKDIHVNIPTGGKYDKDFRFNNGKYYCSELVWEVYRQNGIILTESKQLKEYHFLFLPSLQKHIVKRGFNMDQEVIAPSDLIKSSKLKTIYFSFNNL
jgi:hypothetical protein